MELNLNLDDDDFYKNDKESGTKIDFEYQPRQCLPNWFFKSDDTIDNNQNLLKLRFAADNAYMKKNYLEAIQICNQIFNEPNHHKVIKFVWVEFTYTIGDFITAINKLTILIILINRF